MNMNKENVILCFRQDLVYFAAERLSPEPHPHHGVVA